MGKAWWVVRRAVVVTLAVGVIGFIYWMGLPDVGGALALSGLLVLLALYVRTGALAPICQQPRHLIAVRNCARWELSKAMICAGLGLDIVRLIVSDARFYFLNYGVVSQWVLILLIAVWLLGTGAFIVRSFAAYLLSLRP